MKDREIHRCSSCRACCDESGFTIIEMLVALSLLVVVMIPLTAVFIQGFRTSVTTKTQMNARQVASAEMDRARSLNFNAVGITGATASYASAPTDTQIKADTGSGLAPVSTVTQGENTFTVTRDVRKVIKSSAATKKIIITVSWTTPLPGGSYTLPSEIGPTGMAP